MDKIGKWAFIVGFVLSVVAGLLVAEVWMYWVMLVLGLVVGFLNVTAEVSQSFLLSAIALMLSATSVLAIPYIGEGVTSVVANLVAFIAPAVLVVALKSLFETAKD